MVKIMQCGHLARVGVPNNKVKGCKCHPRWLYQPFLCSVGEKLRQKYFNCDHHNSVGLKSGEYGDKFRTLYPTDAIICSIDASLCAGKLSITTTAPGHNYGSKKCSINTLNAMLAIELFIVINPTTSLILTAHNRICYSTRSCFIHPE